VTIYYKNSTRKTTILMESWKPIEHGNDDPNFVGYIKHNSPTICTFSLAPHLNHVTPRHGVSKISLGRCDPYWSPLITHGARIICTVYMPSTAAVRRETVSQQSRNYRRFVRTMAAILFIRGRRSIVVSLKVAITNY